MTNEPLKVEKPLLESLSEIDKLPCITNTEHSPDTKITVMGQDFLLKNFEWWRVSTDRALVSKNIYWRSPKMKCIVSLEVRKQFSWKICTENLWTSVKILADLQLSLRSSGTIFTDAQGKLAHRYLQILKESSTWDLSKLLLMQKNVVMYLFFCFSLDL